MGNSNLKGTNDILVKVDQNNLIYLDPNSVLINGEVQPRAVQPENLIMYVNLEADLVSRSILTSGNETNTLLSIAKGTLNFLQNKDGRDYDTKWTEAYTDVKARSGNDSFFQNDESGQSFGIDNISIQITGANFIPKIEIKFIDVRGKTLFESPENSPYSAFFHLPWPIFYLTVKGYYGKAIKYRLHMVKFNSRYNDTNGNFEVSTTFVGSTYAYLADISLETILNAPYFYASDNILSESTNEGTGIITRVVSKTTKGYRVLKSIYQEYVNKGLLPPNFPVKTLRELIVLAGRLNKLLEKQIFEQVINHNILAGVKEYEDTLNNFEQAILTWKRSYLSSDWFPNGQNRVNPLTGLPEVIRWFKFSGMDKGKLDPIIGPIKGTPLNRLITNFVDILEKNEAFGVKRTAAYSMKNEIKTKEISCTSLKNIQDFYITGAIVGVDIDGLLDRIYDIQKDFVEQRNKLESDIEKKMNDIVRSDKTIGLGFEPTVRNIIGVVLANAETYIRLMKDVHNKAFESAQERRKLLLGVSTDADKAGNAIYPWPEVKQQTAGGRELVLEYPGSKELTAKLHTDNKVLWPEVDFVENFFDISTKRADPLTGKEGNIDNINYVFDSTTDVNKKDISVLTNIMNYIPYSDKSISSIFYELYERAKYTTSLSPFNDDSIDELANIEYINLKNQVIDDIDVVGVLKSNIKNKSSLITQLQNVSKNDRYPYYEDQLPTVSYIKDAISQDFSIQKYDGYSKDIISSNNKYPKLSKFMGEYQSEDYRKDIYPFNSSTYLNQTGMRNVDLNLNKMLFVNAPNNFIASPVFPVMWVKDGYTDNLFTNTVKIKINVNKQILNTPYFHKQLFDDFNKTRAQEKYVGSAYILLNSLPFKDLDDKVNNVALQTFTNGRLGNDNTLVSSLFREIGATHYIPYHMMLKWGSIYHRYKKWITESIDIIGGVTTPINGSVFFDNSLNRVYTGVTTPTVITIDRSTYSDVGFHPYYEDVFHQIINGYLFFDPIVGPTDYNNMVSTGVTKTYYGNASGGKSWATIIDNSRFDTTDKRYTLLPTNGYNDIDATNFIPSEQENFRTIWNIGVTKEVDIIYSGYTLPAYDEYFKTTGTTGTYSLDYNYRKVIDLIATFKPDILDTFELAFLNFASEKLNEEMPYKPYDVKYSTFQDLLKKISSVTKNDDDSTKDIKKLLSDVKARQVTELQYLTNELLSNDNLIRFSMGNPREIDNYVLGGFTGVNVKNFSTGTFDPSQITDNNIELYLGKDMDGYYEDFFISNNIQLSDDNIKQFRPLIYSYAGQRAKGIPLTKSGFITHLKNTIVTPSKTTTGVSGQDDRLNNFLTLVITKIQSSDFDIKSPKQSSIVKRGYKDDGIKLELYNYFKSFNDKWTAGNSIGQRTLMEEFLFLDKANRDIGSSVYIDMEKLLPLMADGNEKINLYSLIGLLVQDTGFDIRALPAYVNFYGTNFSNTNKIVPSKNVAQNMFGTFLDVDFQESSPKIILQYIGPTSKHLELSDINKKYKFKNDGFDIGNVHQNPIIVAPDIFTKTDLSKSNKVVAFEVSFGDQNQSIFKGVELDQSSIKNTSESFEVLERLGRSETGASTAQVDIGLFDIYRQSSYQCQVTAMGNVMIQPTMYFYLKNIPLFKGSYWITEVTHDIKTTGITTMFKGTRIPNQSLPNPTDSFLASYRSLFDKIVKQSTVRVKQEHQALSGGTNNQKVIVTAGGSYSYNTDNIKIPGETPIQDAGITEYGISYNGYGNGQNVQLVTYNNSKWLRARVVIMDGPIYKIADDIVMSIASRLTTENNTITWKDVKGFNVNPPSNGGNQQFYVCNFDINLKISANKLISDYTKTEFLNPMKNKTPLYTAGPIVTVKTDISSARNKYEGPISVGPVTPVVLDAQGYLADGYGIGLSKRLAANLGVYDGGVVYFRML